jgi:hypothetical protein
MVLLKEPVLCYNSASLSAVDAGLHEIRMRAWGDKALSDNGKYYFNFFCKLLSIASTLRQAQGDNFFFKLVSIASKNSSVYKKCCP